MKYTALVPVKSLTEAKSRLASHMTPEQRAALMLDMLHHVIDILHKSQQFAHVTVVSADTRVLELAQAWGAIARIEEQTGHNPALTAAAHRELEDGADALLTISADLPLLQTNDIHGIIQASTWHDVVLAPSQDRTGTNALLSRPPLVIPYLFGVNSFPRYLAQIERQHVQSTSYTGVGLALDIDTIDDIQLLKQHQIDSTTHFLSSLIG